MNTKMNKYDDPKLSLETHQSYQGYSLQVFTSGRIKLSLHISHTHRVEYYGECPKRFREAYARQSQRSLEVMPDHFTCVDAILEGSPASLIHRVHLKADIRWGTLKTEYSSYYINIMNV